MLEEKLKTIYSKVCAKQVEPRCSKKSSTLSAAANRVIGKKRKAVLCLVRREKGKAEKRVIKLDCLV